MIFPLYLVPLLDTKKKIIENNPNKKNIRKEILTSTINNIKKIVKAIKNSFIIKIILNIKLTLLLTSDVIFLTKSAEFLVI